MAHCTVRGCQLWYQITGEGDHLLQIGGAGFAHENFALVTDSMTEHFSVIEFDLRGYGLSERPVQPYSMEVWADDIADLLKAIGVQKTHVHGTSLGGTIAVALASKYPELVDRLVVDCALVKADETADAHMEVWKALARSYGMGGRELALMIATHCLSRDFLDSPAGPETIETISGVLERNCAVEVFTAALDAVQEADLRADLSKITAPTLVMVGDQDVLTPLDTGPNGAGSRYIAEHIPGAELYVVEDSAHTNLMEQPELSARVVIDFLKGGTVGNTPVRGAVDAQA